MHITTICFAVVLMIIGLAGYLGSPAPSAPSDKDDTSQADASQTNGAGTDSATKDKKASRTALIPTAIGMVFLILGTLGIKPEWRKHVMHIAVGLALLGCMGVGARIGMKLGPWLSQDPEVNSRAMVFQTLMFLACAVYLGLGVRSFIQARKARQNEAAKTGEPA